MEKLIKEIGFVKEEDYQNFKREFNHESDYFSMEDLEMLKSYLSKTCPCK